MWYVVLCCFFFFKQKTAYEMRISDWSSDVCSSDLLERRVDERTRELQQANMVLQAEIIERQRAEKLQRALYSITEKSVTAGSLERFYADVHSIVGELLYARNFYIALLSSDGEHIEFPY